MASPEKSWNPRMNRAAVVLPNSAPAAHGVLPGLAVTGLCALIAWAAAQAPWLQQRGIGVLTVAIVFGMLAGNTLYPRIADRGGEGVDFAKARLLRLGIVLYGLRLTFQDIGDVGWPVVAIDAAVLCSTFALACVLGTRLFGLDRRTAMLIGAGSSICGAAAVMATGPVVKGRADQIAVAVATVVVFGTLSMFLYPAVYALAAQHVGSGMSETAYGVFTGSTVHEVAQVLAAGRAVGEHAADTALIAKMVRVMMLAPFLLLLSAVLSRMPDRQDAGAETPVRGSVAVPWFALGFIVLAGVNSLGILPPALVAAALDLDTALLAMAMAALGLSTRFSSLREAGLRPLGLAAVLFVWLLAGGAGINLLLNRLQG